MSNHLRVAMGPEGMAALLKARPQLTKVVYLAIQDHSDRAVLIENRLVPCHKIDDSQALDPEGDAVFNVNAG